MSADLDALVQNYGVACRLDALDRTFGSDRRKGLAKTALEAAIRELRAEASGAFAAGMERAAVLAIQGGATGTARRIREEAKA